MRDFTLADKVCPVHLQESRLNEPGADSRYPYQFRGNSNGVIRCDHRDNIHLDLDKEGRAERKPKYQLGY
jgi:hypothetical protein